MYAALLAATTAICLGTGDFSSHFGLRHVKALPGAFFSLCFQVFTLLIVLLIRGRWEIEDWRGPVFFFVVGTIYPGAFFAFLLSAVARLGPARAITLKGTSPIFAVAIAMLLLGERPNLPIFLGLFFLVGGVMYLTADSVTGIGFRKDLVWPLAAAFLAGLAPNLIKLALQYMQDQTLGLVFAGMGALATMFLINVFLAKNPEGKLWLRTTPLKVAFLFSPMGVMTVFGMMAYYTALKIGSVAVVVPIVQTAPFVAILLSRLFIQEREGVNARLIISAVAVVLGAALVSMGRA